MSTPLWLAIYIVSRIIRLFSRDESVFSLEILVQGTLFLVVCWMLLFVFFLVGSSRVWSDHAFTVSGFLATFLGLGILAVFFFRLAGEVAEWFHYTPRLVEIQNERNQKTIEEFDQLKKANEEQLAKLEQERDELVREAKAEAEKTEIRELFADGIARVKRELEETQAESKLIAERSLRPDTSNLGVFTYFLTNSPSDNPQDAGIGPALVGSVWLGLITILFAVPVGVGAALYLEEYRQEGWLAKIIQININNLAGVPSVVYGILGGFAFVYFFRLVQEANPSVAPRNLLGGGLTLGMLTLPVVIVSAQEAIRAVPGSLRQGAYALGATKWQVIWTTVLPMARPGILTGTILSLSRAIGEAAPLVFFGAQLYVDQSPSWYTRFTALPLQIFQWCELPPKLVSGPEGEMTVDIWKYNAAVASSVLLLVLLSLNAVAIILRNRAQKKLRY